MSPSHSVPRHQVSKPESSDTPEVVVRNFETAQSSDEPTETRETAENDSNEAPQLPVLSANNAVLGNLVANQATMPKVAMKVSQGGLVRGNIIHRVPPVYPPDALYQGLSGPVVLCATVNESGAVEQVKTVSGSGRLARAAEEAVKTGRYEPSLLNGDQVKVEMR